tara:strand:- start:2753 stop:3439 length:687 start_codon:yes stop_codon:yes gene_type:complete
VIEQQLKLGQQVPEQTKNSFNTFKTIEELEEKLSRAPSMLERVIGKSTTGLTQLTAKLIQNYSQHQQTIPASLLNHYIEHLQAKVENNIDLDIVDQIEVLLGMPQGVNVTISESIIKKYLEFMQLQMLDLSADPKEIIDKIKKFHDNIDSAALKQWLPQHTIEKFSMSTHKTVEVTDNIFLNNVPPPLITQFESQIVRVEDDSNRSCNAPPSNGAQSHAEKKSQSSRP